MIDVESNAYKKYQRAMFHLHNLKCEISKFTSSSPFELRQETIISTKTVNYYFEKVTHVPDIIFLTAGDVIHNLRSSLDQLVYSMFDNELLITPDNKHLIHFPVKESREQFEKFMNKGKGRELFSLLSDSSKSIINEAQPYRDGNQNIYALHKLDVIDKHRSLLTITTWDYIGIGTGMIKNPNANLPVLVNDKLISFSFHDLENIIPPQISYRILINEPEIGKELLLEYVKVLAQSVKSILDQYSEN